MEEPLPPPPPAHTTRVGFHPSGKLLLEEQAIECFPLDFIPNGYQ